MKRRRVLAALLGLGITGGSFWVAENGLPADVDGGPGAQTDSPASDGDGSSIATEQGDSPTTRDGSTTTQEAASFSIRVETMEAQGSQAGHVQVPEPNTPTVIDLFATWCSPCKKQMEALGAVHADYGDRVAFVSVTNERIGGTLSQEDVREWWRKYDGNWTLGLDPESELMSALGANGFPFLAIADASGTIRWKHAGITKEETLRQQLDQVLDS